MGSSAADCQTLAALLTGNGIATPWTPAASCCSYDSRNGQRVVCDATGRVTEFSWMGGTMRQLTALGSLSSLKTLNLNNNAITGPVPSWVSTLTNLESLSLAQNTFDGPFPDLSALKKLTSLQATGNSWTNQTVTGKLPASLTTSCSLYPSGLCTDTPSALPPACAFDSSFPTSVLPRCTIPSPATLVASPDCAYVESWLTANGEQVPWVLGRCCGWYGGNFRRVECTGSPDTSQAPPRITTLWMQEIGAKEFTDALAGLGGLVYVDLSSNTITGPFPTVFQGMRELRELWLSGNKISGQIPSYIGNLTSLRGLQLDSNALTGDLPDMTGLINLRRLYLNGNSFSHAAIESRIPPYVTHCNLESAGLCRSLAPTAATKSAACYTTGLESCDAASVLAVNAAAPAPAPVTNPVIGPPTPSSPPPPPSGATSSVGTPMFESVGNGGYSTATVAAIVLPLIFVVLGLLAAGAWARRRYRVKRGHDPPWWPSMDNVRDWFGRGSGSGAGGYRSLQDDSNWILSAPNGGTNGASAQPDEARRLRSSFGRKLSQRNAKNGIKEYTLGLDPARRATKLKRSRSNASSVPSDARPSVNVNVRRPITPPSEDEGSEREGSVWTEMDARSDVPGSPMAANPRRVVSAGLPSAIDTRRGSGNVRLGGQGSAAPSSAAGQGFAFPDLIDLGSGYEGSESGVDSIASPVVGQPTSSVSTVSRAG
ncbi:L domain-like protein [Gonapodya prolifera JEL478]|uniref:L domain-like protein n=1 Tax=Gonapodya prolifera (strain JEL478) TaxID=1344416 RepID=A0A139AEG1_GONPJ|nr:L domain-like protein [Gonapodya prolifera JEL478]|eukprot:KXS15202.1 L domain-like protein [Gonapodya prolifera JEL478]